MNIAEVPVLPHSKIAETGVLGSLMIDSEAWVEVNSVLNDQDFHLTQHKILYAALMDMYTNNLAVDVVTVSEHLEKKGFLDKLGGLSGLVGLVTSTPTSANIVAYADIVRQKSLLRQLIRVSAVIGKNAYGVDGDAKSIIADAETAIFKIAEQGVRGRQEFSDIQSILIKVADVMEANDKKPDSGVLGVATGFIDLDNGLKGLQNGNLVIVAGRPSMGKTAFSVNICEHVSLNAGPVAIFSMEMQAEELGQRILSSQAGVEFKKIKQPWVMDDADWPKVTLALGKTQDAKLFIDDDCSLSIDDIRSKCMRLQSKLGENGLKLIMVDYIQLMQANGENRTVQIGKISRGLKRLAKEFNVPVLALSQLNRSLEKRANRRPLMSDLRESGDIEQDADIILFLYRDEVYEEFSDHKGMAEVGIAKNRNGELGMARLHFRGDFVQFANLAHGGEFR